MQIHSKSVRARKRMLFLAPLLTLVVGVTTYIAVRDAHEKIVEFQAANVAEIVVRHATSSRSVYAADVAGKLTRDGTGGPHMDFEKAKGLVPLPAQFLKMVGLEATRTSDNLYRYRPLSKWNLEPTQGVVDDFQKWAWAQLEAQDQANPTGPIAWKPVWRVERINGESTLRFMRADPASATSCVDCHNALEKTYEIAGLRRLAGIEVGRTWKLHQLLGAVEVSLPLNKVEAVVAEQTRRTMIWVISALVGGLLFVTWFAASDLSRTQKLLTLSWLTMHDSASGLYNTRGLLPQITRVLALPEAHGKRHGMFYLRLEGIEDVISACGNKAGEQLAKHIADVMRRRFGPTCLIGRIHGGEFAGLLIDDSVENIKKTAASLLYSIKIVRFRWKEKVFHVGANIGVAMMDQTTDADEALKSAREACLAAERAGKHQVQIYGA